MFRASADKLRAILLESVFPRYCGLCDLHAGGAAICPSCLDELPRICHPCGRCASPMPAALPEHVECGICQRDGRAFDRAYAPLEYGYPIDRAIKAFKFGKRQELAPMLAAIVLPWLEDHRDNVDALVPVPLHRWRHARRGFNQAHEIARELRKATSLPIDLRTIRRRQTKPQPGLHLDERHRNLAGAFRVRGALRCRRPLIVDDVMTTGATVNELAITLLEAGADTVSVLAIARAAPPKIARSRTCRSPS